MLFISQVSEFKSLLEATTTLYAQYERRCEYLRVSSTAASMLPMLSYCTYTVVIAAI